MSEFLIDESTAVNTQNNSAIDLKLDSNEERIFKKHPVHKLYRDIYLNHLDKHKDNPLIHEINENIWPMLTGQTLVGPRKISYRSPSSYVIDPIYLETEKVVAEDLYGKGQNYSYTFLHFGDELSGHKALIHGGLLATILDELTCRLAFQNFPSRKGVTASLSLSYKKPCYVNSYVLVRCEVTKKSGRKCWVKGSIYGLNLEQLNENSDQSAIENAENLLTECECLVIEPRWVKELQNAQ
ncbi:hypothetical protein CAAN1_11S02542 [[Candida] anglica]|uniref:Thioesterase domain-containing protein n=1 Tax=[Candida] anglica TaxID=148631 RepID=A0ABP0EI21_9ASCO